MNKTITISSIFLILLGVIFATQETNPMAIIPASMAWGIGGFGILASWSEAQA